MTPATMRSPQQRMLRIAAKQFGVMGTYIRAVPLGAARRPPLFVVFGQGRTGSTLLQHMLNSHSQIHCDGELLAERRLFPAAWIAGRRARARKPMFGFRIKIADLLERQDVGDPAAFISSLYDGEPRMIYLWRRNVARQSVSNFLAAKRGGLWNTASAADRESALNRAVELDPDALARAIELREELRRTELEVVASIPHTLTLVYEDDLAGESDRDVTSRRIADFLSLDPEPMPTSLLKLSVRPLHEQIVNFAEMQAVAVGLGYSLDD